MDDDWHVRHRAYPGGYDTDSIVMFGLPQSLSESTEGNPEFAVFWATLTLKQKIVGSLCSIAVGAVGAGLLIALFAVLH